MMKEFIASTLVATATFIGGADTTNTQIQEQPQESARYEYFCDRIEKTHMGVDYAVIEVYDRYTDTTTIIDVALPSD